MTVLLHGIVSGTPVRASVAAPVGVSAELATHHLRAHPCPVAAEDGGTGLYTVESFVCEDDGVVVRVVRCEVCGSPLAVVAPDVCEHVPTFVGDLNDGRLA